MAVNGHTNQVGPDHRAGRRRLRRARGGRMLTGVHVLASVLLALAAVVFFNTLAAHYTIQRDISSSRVTTLSPKTVRLLSQLEVEVTLMAFMSQNHRLAGDVRILLRAYEAAGGAAGVATEIVDPNRDLVRTRKLVEAYEVTEENTIVVEAEGRRKYVPIADFLEHRIEVDGITAAKKLVGFRGEQLITSAIQTVLESVQPTVYFLDGHQEHSIGDYTRQAGYSSIARELRRESVTVKTLRLEALRRVPEDAAAVVLAGPRRRLADVEVDLIEDYLEHHGRLMVLLDPAVDTNLEELLGNWGVQLAQDVVVGLTLTGSELLISDYGEHPVTRGLTRLTTMFYQPRSIRPRPGADRETAVDKPRVTVLAASTKHGWSEFNLEETPPRFDTEVDRQGPVPVAVAIEKGTGLGIEVGIRPTRLVVVGDSTFVGNAALESGIGGNVDFFMGSMNWLMEREALLDIAPRAPGELRLEMNSHQWRNLFLLVVVISPLVVAGLGVVVWLRRRY